MLAKKREMEEAARAEKAEAEAKRELDSASPTVEGSPRRSSDSSSAPGPDANRRANSNMDIQIGNIQLYGGRQELLTDATLKLVHGTKYGLVGRNGTGKSTLLHAMSTFPIPMPEHRPIIHVEQEAAPSTKSAIQTVLDTDLERNYLLEIEKILLDEDKDTHEGIDLNEVYERLDEIGGDEAIARAGGILGGLGFDAEMQNKATKEFSGGWRMRISLAQALFMTPDLLLLDEPTNHLDDARVDVAGGIFAAVGKDGGDRLARSRFLNDTTTATMFLHNKRLRYYGGNYDTFVKVRAEHRANEQAVAANQSQRGCTSKISSRSSARATRRW